MNFNEFHRRGQVKRKRQAQERLDRVRALRNEGLSGPEIAKKLGISYASVKHYFGMIRRNENFE